ncbi:glycosyltransferase family 39 protein [Candidatus Woesearchaeota archaeon]|nr:glycosyltransferase family 39 protein [Candidatus Woesearchaeota archaeon]
MKPQNKASTAALLILAAAIILFTAIEFRGLFHYDNSDENLYFYMSSLVADGQLPYRDFFYAHPPLELAFGAVVFKLLGFSLFLLKLLPLAATIISALMVYLVAKRNFGEQAAVLAAAFFLSSHTIMLEATYFLGLNIAVMFLMLGFYYMNRKPLLSGLLFGLAGMTRLLALIPAAVLIGFLLLKNFKSFAKTVAGFAAVFGTANLALMLLSPNFVVSVYKFHLLKPAVEGRTAELFPSFITANALLIGAAAIAFLAWNKKLLLFAGCAAAYLILLTQLNKIFGFYFVVAIPFLAVIAGANVDALLKKINYQKLAVIAVAAITVINAAYIASHLWTFDFANFETAKEMAGFVRENTQPNDTIFGDATSAPLVALFSGRKLMNNIADTNELVYLSGVRNLSQELEMVKGIKGGGAKFVITRPLYGVGSLEETQQFLESNCKPVKHYKDPYHADFLMHNCS